MDFIPLSTSYPARYPVGQYVHLNMKYVNAVATVLHDKWPDEEILLIGKGSSGSILAGMIASIMESKYDKDVDIFICRKTPTEVRHGNETIPFWYDNWITVVIDDFMDTGATVESIITEIRKTWCKPDYKFDALCISNYSHEYTRWADMLENAFDAVICRCVK